MSKNDLVPIQKNVENISTQLDNWAKQIHSRGEQLLRDADNILLGIKNIQKEIELNVLITALQYAITAAEKIAEDTLKTESNKLQIKINFWEAEVKSLATAIPDWISALKKLHYFRLKEFDPKCFLSNYRQKTEKVVSSHLFSGHFAVVSQIAVVLFELKIFLCCIKQQKQRYFLYLTKR